MTTATVAVMARMPQRALAQVVRGPTEGPDLTDYRSVKVYEETLACLLYPSEATTSTRGLNAGSSVL